MSNIYKNGKIQKINDIDDRILFGNTTNILCKRYAQIKTSKNEQYEFLNKIGWHHSKMIWVENYPCENINQLKARQNYWECTLNKEVDKNESTDGEDDLFVTAYNKVLKERAINDKTEKDKTYVEKKNEIEIKDELLKEEDEIEIPYYFITKNNEIKKEIFKFDEIVSKEEFDEFLRERYR